MEAFLVIAVYNNLTLLISVEIDEMVETFIHSVLCDSITSNILKWQSHTLMTGLNFPCVLYMYIITLLNNVAILYDFIHLH